MAHIKSISFNHYGKNEGCICDRCGKYIQNVASVNYVEGVHLNFGMDCFEKVHKAGLNKTGKKLMNKAIDRIKYHTEKLEAYTNGIINEENDEGFKTEQMLDGYWKGKDYEEYRDFMIHEFLPKRLEEDQKMIDKFKNVNFEI